MTNFLEQLVAEWYEFQGYFVRRNVLVGKRKKGGYEGELDVVALHPDMRHLIHIEPSMDADSWSRREERYSKKFALGKKYIRSLFSGMELPSQIDQIALLAFGSKQNHATLGNGKVVLISELMADIHKLLVKRSFAKEAVPEQFVILRSLHFAASWWNVADNVRKP